MTEATLNPPEPFSAIIFDCDGTLVDTSHLYYRAFSQVVGTQGAEMPRAWFVTRFGLAEHELLCQFQEEFGIALDPAEATDLLARAYWQGIETVREIEVVASVARRYQGRVPMAVASGGARKIVRATLLATGLLDVFNAVVTREDAEGRGKPAPDLFEEAARRLGVAPTECTVFEDSDAGIEAARRAGMTATDVRLVYQPAWLVGITPRSCKGR
jgi:beta-phosphoglucomutase-like phosphatase (HAD superfamily)